MALVIKTNIKGALSVLEKKFRLRIYNINEVIILRNILFFQN